MVDPLSGKAPSYIKPGTRKNPDVKDEKTLYWHDKRDVKKAERETLSLGEIPKETLKEQRIREEKERVEKSEQLTKYSSDKTLFDDSIDLIRISRFFGVDPSSFGEYKDKLNVLWEWGVNETKSQNYVNVLGAIHKLEKNIDIGWGDNRINAIYRWIRLDLDAKRLDQEKKLYEK